MPLSPKTFSYASRGLRLSCHAWGDDSKPPLLFLHGFLDQGLSFKWVAEHLASKYYVLAPDHRGHGQSDWIGTGGFYHFPDYLQDLAALMDHCDLDAPILAGHSMGASIAIYWAGAFPTRLSHLILLDGLGPSATAPGRSPSLLRDWLKACERTARSPQARLPEISDVMARIERMSPRTATPILAELAEQASVRGEDGQYRFRFDPLHRTPSPVPFDPDRFIAFLKSITCPTLLLWGEHTPFKPTGLSARLSALEARDSHVLPGTGHNIHHEAPEVVATRILSFLSTNGPTDG
jgi:pimeloyl-ACP methyl ester carboxylesterase